MSVNSAKSSIANKVNEEKNNATYYIQKGKGGEKKVNRDGVKKIYSIIYSSDQKPHEC